MSRVSQSQLVILATTLSARERDLVQLVARLRLMSHAQLAALLPDDGVAVPGSAARSARRLLARLAARGVLARLERRVGGVRAGSGGYVYYLGPVGQRLVAYWQGHGLTRGRFRPEPGGRYVRHRLAVSELYVQLRSADRGGELDLLSFDPEPDCWRRSLDGFGGTALLKPDAFVRIGVGAYEDRCFVEVDLGTESRSVIAAKLRAYLDYFRSGHEQAAHGVFPRVVWLTNSEARRAALVGVVGRLPAEHWGLFTVAGLDQGMYVLSGRLAAVTSRESPVDSHGGWA
jgi:hypothetical protein